MPHLRVSLHLNLQHLFVGAVLQVQKVLGRGSTDPHGAVLKGNLGGQEKNWGVEPPNLTPAILTLHSIIVVIIITFTSIKYQRLRQ